MAAGGGSWKGGTFKAAGAGIPGFSAGESAAMRRMASNAEKGAWSKSGLRKQIRDLKSHSAGLKGIMGTREQQASIERRVKKLEWVASNASFPKKANRLPKVDANTRAVISWAR